MNSVRPFTFEQFITKPTSCAKAPLGKALFVALNILLGIPTLGVFHLWFRVHQVDPSTASDSIKKIDNTSQKTLQTGQNQQVEENPEQKIIETKAIATTGEGSGKYDQQLIIDLGNGKTAQGLTKKVPKGVPTKTIDKNAIHNNTDGLISACKDLTPRSRLYIIGHCNPGWNVIESDEHIRLTVKEIVEALQSAPKLQEKGKGRLKISLVACHAARPTRRGGPSFAEQLSVELDKYGIEAEVVGFEFALLRYDNTDMPYKKIVDSYQNSKKPGTKCSVITKDGKTTIEDVRWDVQQR